MKRIFKHPKPTDNDVVGPNYWRSPDELAGDPRFDTWLHQEFPSGAAVAEEGDRRTFLKLMGASFGLAGLGLSGCRMPKKYILPYSKQPENMIPGVSTYYASSQPGAKEHIPLVVETHQARPTKIEGNPSYAGFGGGTNGYAQASVLDLYDPDRARKSASKQAGTLSRGAALDEFIAAHKAYVPKQGKGLAILAEASSSPTRARLVAELKKKLPQTIWAEYEPVDSSNPEAALAALAGKRLRPLYHLDRAKRILSLDADFVATEPGHLKYARDFAKGRKILNSSEAGKMNRLYAVESNFTLTGGMADHRLRAATSHMPAFAALMAAELLSMTGGSQELIAVLKKQGTGLKVDQKWLTECARDLYKNRGEAVVFAGAHLPLEVHALAYAMNQALDAEGKTVTYVQLPDVDSASITTLAEAIEAGQIDQLFVLGGNPVYNAPADLDWAALQSKAGKVVRWGYHEDETAVDADVFVAATHYLESWGDGRTMDGVYVPVQPMILPLFDGISELEAVAHLAGVAFEDAQGYDLVRATFNAIAGTADQLAFDRWLTEGVLPESEFKVAVTAIAPANVVKFAAGQAMAAQVLSKDRLELRIVPSYHTYDGRYNNNGWLMEAPDPLNKLSWDNAVCISPQLAEELGLLANPIKMDRDGNLRMNANQFDTGREQAKIVELQVGDTVVKGPAHIQPGLADYTVVLSLGFGRTVTGRIGTDSRRPEARPHGFDVYPFVTAASPSLALNAQIKVTDEVYEMANTQEHWSMEGRAIIREANVEDYEKHPKFVDKMGMESHSPPIYGKHQDKSDQFKVTEIPRGGSAYETPEFTGEQQWGMSIDLNTCTGCNACVIACQSENNIPIVGKDQVLRGREMHWIRLDRYYSDGLNPQDNKEERMQIPHDPQVSFMGVACMHCELAPCESVCPVNATVHDQDGLNVMAYNRCVGTRYCANNCPYKVRRFNFFDYNKRDQNELYKGPLGEKNDVTTTQMQKNPDVTVRMRGVMEKCTYCVQRIQEAKIDQRTKAKDSANVNVKDGTIKTACQQVCPVDAIVFGDVADAATEVSRMKTSDRDYSVLGYLNIRPRTTYLAKLRNPNMAMPGAQQMPLSRVEYENRYGHASHGGDHGDAHASPSSAKAHH